MKTSLFSALLLLFLAGTVCAQKTDSTRVIESANDIKTLAGQSRHFGFYFGLGLKNTTLANDNLLLGGARLGLIANRSFAMGIEGYGIIPIANYSQQVDGKDAILLGGYGGLTLEPIFFSNKAIHFTVPIHTGAGWLGFQESWLNNFDYSNSYNTLLAEDVFWYVEPGLNLEVNISRMFRLNLGASKRFVSDLSLPTGIASKDFSSMTYNFTLKIGRF